MQNPVDAFYVYPIPLLGTTAPLVIPVNGFLTVYLSNETAVTCDGCMVEHGDVFFDDVVIRFIRGNLKEENHYYPFGLPMGDMGSAAAGFTPNRRKYQSNEYIKEAGLNWMDFHARQYDPQIGRFLSVDPLAVAGGQDVMSPYAAMGNEWAAMTDPDGMMPGVFFTHLNGKQAPPPPEIFRGGQDASELDPFGFLGLGWSNDSHIWDLVNSWGNSDGSGGGGGGGYSGDMVIDASEMTTGQLFSLIASLPDGTTVTNLGNGKYAVNFTTSIEARGESGGDGGDSDPDDKGGDGHGTLVHTYRLDGIPLIEQMDDWSCVYACMQAVLEFYGIDDWSQEDLKQENNNREGVSNYEEIYKKMGFKPEGVLYENINKIFNKMDKQIPSIMIERTASAYGHAVIPVKVEFWITDNKAIYKTWVMNPTHGLIESRPIGYWKNSVIFGYILNR